MKEFTFDIQRFACTMNGTAYQTLQAAIAAAPTDGTETTITVTSQTRETTAITVASGKNITINFANYSCVFNTNLTINSGATVTLSGGTITGTQNFTNSGTLTVTDMTMSAPTLTSQSNGSTTISGATTIKIAAGTASYTYALGNLFIATGGSDGSGTLTVTTASDGSATISPTVNGYFTDKKANATYTRAIISGVTFSYDSSGNISIGNFTDTTSSSGTHTNTFSIKDNTTNVTTTYTVIGNSLKQTTSADSTVKIWSGDSITQTTTLTPTELATDSNYTLAHLISDAALEFDGIDASEEVIIVDADDFTKKYGTLTESGGIYHLTKDNTDTALSSITISDGSTVELAADFAGVEITVDTTKFKTVDSTTYTVTSSDDIASIGGTTNISLNSGSVLTSESTQTVAASSYNVYGYSGGEDGIVIATDKVGDIQVGESFVVNGTTYTRKEYGLTIEDDGEEKVYVGNYDTDNYKAGIAVTLSNLNDDNFTKFSKFIQPADSVLTVGGDNNVNAVVSNTQPTDETASNVKKFGEIQVDTSTNAYTLTATDGGDVSAFATTGTGEAVIATISVAGGDTTIDKGLADGRFIATAGGAIFTVESVSGSTFTVNGTSDTPTVKDATEITLHAGSIVTDSNITQTVNLNGAQTITVDKCEMEITFTDDNTFTVNGTAGDTFTLGGKQYTIAEGSDGMTFTITADGITISDLGTTDVDVFTATDVNSGNAINYSVRGAGFIKEESGAYQIWTPADNQHTLTDNTVTVESLTSADNWKTAATVDSDTKAATLPTAEFGYLVGYDDFKNIYGTFTSDGNTYTIDTVDSTDKLSAVSVGSDVGVLSMQEGLDNVVIQSANVTLAVTNPGSDGVYEVTLTGGLGGTATVSTGEAVSLIGGSLKADSQVTVTALDNVLIAGDATTLTVNTDGTDATISALEPDNNFKVGSATYKQTSVVGLINESGNYLFGSKKDGIKLSDINNTDRWGELIAAEELLITSDTKNVLVVDSKENPATLYADYDAGKSLLSQSNGGTAWVADSLAISIDNTTVNFTKEFANVTIRAAQSDAEFLIGDSTTFKVTDVKVDAEAGASITSYASIGNANNITQTGGTIYITDAAQIVNTANGTVSSAAGVTVFVSGDKTTVGALDVNESLAVDGATYTREQIGFMDSSDQLLLNTADLTQVAVDSLQSDDWKKTDAVSTANVLTLPTSTDEDEWIIIDSDKSTIYGSLTSDAEGAITVDRNDTSFSILAKTSKAAFSTDTKKFTVTDADAGASISSEAELITQTGGVIALADKNQSIVGGDNTINASSLGSDNVITVNMSSGTAVIGALDEGEIFIVDGETYTLKDNGRFERASDGKVWNGATVGTEGGSINVASLRTESYWNSLAQITSGTDLTIDESKTSVVPAVNDAAFIVDATEPTKIYGTFTKTGEDAYKLSTDGKTAETEFNTITVTKDAPQVTFTNAFKDKTIIADNTATVTSTATSDFTLFYDGTVASVTGSTALTLTNGTLTAGDTKQVITAGDNTVQVKAGTVTVALKDNAVTVDSLDEANDSVTVNGTTYTLTDATGNGFTINIANGVTSLSGVDNGDKFTIGNATFIKTSAGFFKTDDNGNAYMWTNSSDDFNGTDVSRLTATASTDWTAIVDTDDAGALKIDTNSITSIVVDSVTDPTMIRGKLTKSGNAITLETYGDTDTKPTAITVDAATATITDAFNTIPITATNSAVVTTDTDKTLTFSTDSDTFSVNGTAYKMTGAGLTMGGNKIWTAAGATSYVLPDDSAWSTLLTLDSNNKLDLTSQTAGDGSNVIVDSTSTTRAATLTYTESSNTYAFTKTDGDIATIAFGTGTATVTTDFAANVTAQSGATVTVNSNKYTAASNITVAATASSSTLDTGTVTIAQGDTVTADATISVTDSSSITATAAEGKWTSLGDLDNGEKFTIGTTNYQVYGTTALVTLDGDGEIASVCSTAINNGTIAYDALSDFGAVVQLEEDGTLDLTTDLGITEAVVIEQGKPSAKVATLTYDSSTGYTLATVDGGSLTNFKGVTLGKNIPQFTTAIATTITANDTGTTYTVNSKAFTAQSALTIATDAGTSTDAFLTDGTVTLAANDTVTARRTSGTVTTDEVIASTSGTVTVAVTDSTTTTIGDIDNAEKFTVNGTEYLATSIGLAVEADKTLIKDAATSGTVTTDALTGAVAYVEPTADVLTINSDAMSSNGSALVIDISTPAQAKIFGTLTKNGSAYTLTTTDKVDGDDLSGIAIDGVTATIAKDYADTPITAGGGTFTVTATGDFTVNTTTTPVTFTAVDLITLTAGSLDASTTTPLISIKAYTVDVTNGEMEIGIDATSGKAYIEDLDNGDTFTVNETKYRMGEGVLFRIGDDGAEAEATGYNKTTAIFTIDDDDVDLIIAVDSDGTLDLTVSLTAGTTYKVYDSLTKPTKNFAELEVSTNGDAFTLTKNADDFTEGCISAVDIAAGKTLTADFATTVEVAAPDSSAVTTVNSVKYNATSALTIAATESSATLTEGTITLDDTTYKTATDTSNKTLRATEGTFNATAKDGSFTTVNDLQADDSFTYDSATYTQKALGLMNASNQIREDLTPESNVTLSTLATSDKWTAVLVPENNALDISGVTVEKAFVYSDETYSTKLATLTLADNTFTLKPAGDTIEGIDTVEIAAGVTLKVSFETQVEVAKPSGTSATTTVNGKEYTGTTALVIDATANSSTLNEGTVTIASGDSVTATDTYTLAADSGDGITAVAEGGSFTTVKDLGAGDAFTWKDKTYTYSTQGLLNDSGQICESLNGSTVDLAELDSATFIDFLAPDDNGTLTLADGLSGSITVFDDETAPTKKLATLTVGDDGSLTLAKGKDFTDDVIKTVAITEGKTLTVKFTTQVTAPASTVTVNGNEYVGTTKLTLDSDGTTSTLTQGTVTLAQGSSVTPTDNDTITATTGDLTVKATTSAVTISDIADGDVFTVGSDSYAMDADYFYKTDDSGDRLVYTGTVDIATKGITLTQLDADDWGILLEVVNGELTVNSTMSEFTESITEALVVEKPTGSELAGKVYGILTKADDKSFTLTKPDTAQGTLTAITAADVELVMDADFATAAFTVGSSTFSSIALKNSNTTFTADATGTAPAFTDNVSSLTLDSGNVAGVANQKVTTSNRSITPTTVNGTMIIDSEEVSGLDAGDVFTVDDATTYKVLTISDAAQVFNATSPAIVTAGFDGGTLNFAGMIETQALAPTKGVTDLANMTGNAAIVLDSVTAPTTQSGTVTKADNVYTVDFAAQVKTPSTAPVTVNGATYNGESLTLDTTADTSTLNTGTVTLDATTYTSATADKTLTAQSGTFDATAKDGSFTTVSGLQAGDSFTYDGATYTQTELGLMNADGQIREDLTPDTTITLADLTTDWTDLLEVDNGVFTVEADTLTEAVPNARLVNQDHTEMYGRLTRTDAATYTLTEADETLTTLKVNGATVTLNPEFRTASIIANGTEISALTLGNTNLTYTLTATDTPTLSDNVAAFTLGQGSVIVNANQTVTTGENVLKATAGSLTVNASTISDIGTGDTFTLNGKNYIFMDSVGLFNATDSALVDDYADGSVPFGSDETQVVIPVKGVVQLEDVTEAEAIVLSDTTASATKLGNVTMSGTTYTVDYAAQVKTPSTSPVTVNGATYNGESLTLDTTDETSTLTTGTVTLANAESVTTTSNHTVIGAEGDGLTVTAAGSTVTLAELNEGDIFTVDGTEYKVTSAGLYRLVDKAEQIYNGDADILGEGTVTVAQLNADVWGGVSSVEDNTIIIDDSTLANGESTKLTNEDGSKIYGELSRDADGKYTLTKTDDTTDDPTGITINEVTAAIGSDFASVPVTTVNADDSKTTFTATPTKNAETFTVDATGNAPAITDVKEIDLTAGAVAAAVNQPVTLEDGKVVTPTNGTMTIDSDGVSDLAAGDKFTVTDSEGSADYEVIDGVGLFNATDKALVDDFTDSFDFDDTETQILAPNSSGQIELGNVTGDDAIVFDSDTAPTTKLGTVTKADTVYTVDYAAQVKTPSTAPVTVNGATYNGESLTLDTTDETSTLTTGTVTLANAESVTTTSNHTVIGAEGDGLTVTAESSTVTLAELNAGDVFTVDGTEYKVTSAGLYRLVDKAEQIYNGDADILGEGTVTVAQLNADVWGGVSSVEDNTIIIDDSTLANGESTKLTNEDGSKIYGELSRDADGKYTLAKTDDTTDNPTGITINEVTAAIGSDFASVPVTTVNADDSKTTFTATPTKNAETFTVDATGNAPAITDVKDIDLTAGAVAAAVNQPVTLEDGKVVTPTNGTMTIDSDGVSDLAAGDKFTVTDSEGSADYEVIDGVGLFNATDKALVDDFTDSFDFDDTETQILAPNSSGQIELGNVTGDDAIVFDSDTAPTTKLGTVTKADTVYTVDYAAQVVTPSTAPVTVNGKTYNGASLTVDTTADSSTLTQGTVALAEGEDVTTTGDDGKTIKAVSSGAMLLMAAAEEAAAPTVVTVTVNADGTISIGELSTGDIFTVNGAQYKFAAAGLLNPDGDIWTGDDFTDTLTLTALETEDNWTETLEVTDGNLAVDAETLAADADVILVDDADDPTVTYGALVKDSDGTAYTLATDDTSATLNAIAIDGTIMNIDGALASVPVTANENATFTVTPNKVKNLFTVDATTEAPALTDNVKAVALTAGTVTAAVNQPVTIGTEEDASTVTPATINGTMTIGTETIDGLTAGDEFTIDSDSYKLIDGVGLFNSTDKTLADTYADGTMTIGGSETQILAPNSSGQVELDDVTGATAQVFDSDTAPTTKLGEVTKADTDYTVDFATPLKAAAGTFSVNGQPYTATTEAVIQSDGTTSTLTEGTVTVAANGSVTPTGKDAVTDTAGDGLTVKVSGDTVTISGMNDGDTFTVGDAAYKVTAVGPVNGDNKIWTGDKDYTAGLTTTDLATAANWSEMLSAPDGALTVKPSTLEEGDEVIVVDSTKNPTKTYGTLTKDSDGYTLDKGEDDEALSSLTDSGTVIDVDNDLAKVPVTTVVSDGSEATFTVTPAGGTDYFTVDATGTVPKVDNAGAVEVSKGKITAGDGIPVTAADGAQDVDISAGDGTHDVGNKTVKIDGMGTDEEGNKNTVDFGTDDDGNLNSVSGLKEGATVTVDGHTYTAPFDNATLKYNDNDGWYFDGYELEEYTVTVDTSGNVSVDEGVQFSKVVASGKTLDTSGTVKFAANISKTPVTVINNGTTGLNISDYTGDKLAANLGMTDGVKFSGDTTTIESLSEVAGATFTLDRDQSLTGSDATITGGADDTAVLIASRGKTLDIDKAATVNAPAATELLLGNAAYNLNGVALTTGDDTEATLTANGVTVDLVGNDPLKFNGMTLGTSGTATFDTSGNVSLTSGATATNAKGNTLTIDGTVGIDDKTVNVAEATKVTATANGLNVGDDTLTVTGDEDGYIINISASSIVGLEDIGSSKGVTVGGLDDATIATDKTSSLTVDKTVNAPAEVTYTVEDGKLVGVTNAESVSGDFSGGFNVNGTNYSVTGGTATVDSDGDIQTGAGTFTINGHTFTTSRPTTFTTDNASVTGASLAGDGTFAVHQDETNFGVDKDTLTFSGNDNPVTLGTVSGIVEAVNGVNGLLNGLTDATVYDVSTATINGTPISITGDAVNVPVTGGTIGTITGLDAGATVNSAPNLTLTAAENGTFTFVDDSYNVNDTVDATFDFITDSNSRVININGLSGLLSGAVDSISVNGQPFASTSDDVTLATDGTDITAVLGLSSGDVIAGSLSQATITLPEGSVTVNGAPFTLAGDDDGVELSGDGTVISGLDKDATLTVGAADTYNINGKDFAATAGQAYTVNREGVYPINEDFMPITESTNADDILALGASSVYIDPTMTGSQSVAFTAGNNVALIDSPDAPTSVKTGTGTDSVVARHGAQATVDVEDGTPVIVATKGKVTLDNYNDNADIQTFDYTDIAAAVMNNDIKFGDGTMTLGDAVISFGTSAASTGSTLTDIIGAAGDKQAVGFTHTNGGNLDTSDLSDNFILKGNYAQSSSDTQKGNGSSITAGKGNDTVLVGADDTVDAGGGANQIYVTDPALKDAGATIALTSGTNTVHGFNPGFTNTSDEILISDPASLELGFGDSGLTMSSGNAQLTFDGMAAPTVTVAATDDSLEPAAPYELQITDGTDTYKAAIAQKDKDIAVLNGTTADVFIGTDNTGLSFNEFTGPVAVNLSDNEGTLNGSAAQIYGVDKVALGSGNGTLIGAEDTNNTLIAGTGNGSIWSESGNDLMKGNTSADKTGTTTFFYAGGDGRDTIDGFDFMASANDSSADELVILPDATVTGVDLVGDDVVIGCNGGTDDLLTIKNANDEVFRVNGLITKVDDDIVFDGFTECYVGSGDRPTLTVGEGMGEVDIFLGDDEGTEYLGDIAVLDASAANGEMNFLAGSDTDNLIIGGSGENAIWGGDSFSNDTLVGGSGKNTFFFAEENGNDIIQNAHDGDVVDLTYLDADQFAAVEVTSDGVAIDLTDGSHLDVQSNAAVEYKLGDGNTYLVDHEAGEFNRKEN